MLGHHIEFEYCVEHRMARCAFRIITFMGRWSPKWPKVVVFPFIFKLSHPVACCRRLAVRVKVFCDAKSLFFLVGGPHHPHHQNSQKWPKWNVRALCEKNKDAYSIEYLIMEV